MPVTPLDQLFNVNGKSALVTGAASGIGAHLAEMLAWHGANVVALDRREEKLDHVVRTINAHKEKNANAGFAKPLVLDVTAGMSEVDASVEKAWNTLGRIDILLNCAGIAHTGPAIDDSLQQVDAQFATNVRGVYEVSTAVAKRMVKDGEGGSIINIASRAGNVGGIQPGEAVYGASKAAVQHLTRAMALELTPKGIRINSVSPGLFITEMTIGRVGTESMKKYIAEGLPAHRWGDTERDLDGAVLLLASDAGAYMTGTNITVDGGASLALKGF